MSIDTSIALRFGQALAAENYEEAHSLLCRDLQQENPPSKLRQHVEEMTAYDPGPILEVALVPEGYLEEWPSKNPGDLALVYVALGGEGFQEAVHVLLAQEGEAIRIRRVDWGRP